MDSWIYTIEGLQLKSPECLLMQHQLLLLFYKKLTNKLTGESSSQSLDQLGFFPSTPFS